MTSYSTKPIDSQARDAIAIRFAGDSGDGMMLAGNQFTAASLRAGNDVHSFPIFPTEIRAPAGTVPAVAALQVHFGSRPVHTAGDRLDALFVMNPASLLLHLPDLLPGGLLVVNEDAFHVDELDRAGCKINPLHDGSLRGYNVVSVPMDRFNREAIAPVKLLSPREADRCRNFLALGLACWLYNRPLEPTLAWIKEKFAKNPAVVDANTRTLKAGYQCGESMGLTPTRVGAAKSTFPPGKYRRLTGNQGLSLGLAAAARKAEIPLVFASSPMIPATDLQQHFFDMQSTDLRCVHAEDETAAIGIALGAAFAGGLGVTATSGPGLGSMAETIGVAVVAELPLVVIDVQRVGPGSGIPAQSEQGDLLQSLFGRHGESPVVVLAPTSPSDCFAAAFDAARLAIHAMVPVIVLADVHLCYGGEPWKIPSLDDLPAIPRPRAETPFGRDANLARSWFVPGEPGHEHRLGPLEHDANTGVISADPANRAKMVATRAEKIARLVDGLPPLVVEGPESGDLLVLGWGSTAGAIRAATSQLAGRGVACAVIRCLNPLPSNLGEVVKRYRRVLVAELNSGQLLMLVRAKYLIDAIGFSKTDGQPFSVQQLVARIEETIRPQ